MAYAAVLDADVLHPYITADLLLRLAERRLFRPVWNDRILEEVLAAWSGADSTRLESRVGSRRCARRSQKRMATEVEPFFGAVPAAVHPKDRHVVAAALVARADGIVTRNLGDFPAHAIASVGLEVQSLDEFLLNQLTLDESVVIDVFAEIEIDRTRPPRTLDEMLGALDGLAPVFAARVRQVTG